MAVQLSRTLMVKPPVVYQKPVTRGLVYRTPTGGNVISIDTGKQIAFKASLESASMNKKFWDDLLEKLRKSGGGGGGGASFDRVKVSMQLMDFITNKMVKAFFQNIKTDVSVPENIFNSQIDSKNINLSFIQNIGINVIKTISFIIGRDLPLASLVNRTIQNLGKNIENILIAFSFQINKLKEIIDKKLKEIKDILGKNLKKIFRKIGVEACHWYALAFDFFIEVKEGVQRLFSEKVLKWFL